MIRIDHLNKYFNKGKQNEIHVINDISLELPERGMVAVFGRSGCGKTTLLNVIGGLDRFSGGTLTVDGQNIREDTDTLRNREMGYIFQNYNLNKGESCYDNVADALRLLDFPEGWQMRERVEAALANVGMENFANRTPDTLSGGQQQRIAIARAIVKIRASSWRTNRPETWTRRTPFSSWICSRKLPAITLSCSSRTRRSWWITTATRSLSCRTGKW